MTPTTNDIQNGKNMHSSDMGSSGLRQRVSGMTGHVKDTAADFGRSAAQHIDRNLDNMSGALLNAASTLRNKAPQGGGKVSDLAHTAAEKMEGTARYFQSHHTREMMTDFEHVVRRNPGASLAAAVGLGFIIGMSMRRDRY